jgi:predicted secreted hydrolase
MQRRVLPIKVLGACGTLLVAASVWAADSFRLALPGYKFQFPRDHGSHPAFQTEWWYYTGHLQSTSGQRFGYQFTLFRNALVPSVGKRTSRWATRDIILGHLAITDISGRKFYFSDRLSRGAAGLAGAETASATKLPRIWLGDWALRYSGKRGEIQKFRAAATNFSDAGSVPIALELTQQMLKPPAIHGTNGVSQKSAGKGRASHYYSLTRLASNGSLRIGNRKYTVRGQSWFDHEFGSSQLAKNQVGWDWFSLQFDDGRELMLYQLRLRPRGVDAYSSGTLVEKNGRTRHLKVNEFQILPLGTWRSPQSGGQYPARWKVLLPRENIALEIVPSIPNQELNTKRSTNIAYWEGSVEVSGQQKGRALRGRGYVELTGYVGALQSTF